MQIDNRTCDYNYHKKACCIHHCNYGDDDCPVVTKRETGIKCGCSAVSHPSHYNQVPGIECLDVVRHFNFNKGNAIKYIWRAGLKGDELEDLQKARFYIDDEIVRIKSERERVRN